MRRNILVLSIGLLCACVAAQTAVDTVLADVEFSFGKQGDGAGEFFQPMAIAIDANGNLYVADTGNNRIQRFDVHGRLRSMVGGFGWDREQFQRPMDLCADNGLDVYIADHDNRRVERYDRELHWISTLIADSYSDEKLSMGFASGLGLSRHGDLFVADAENRRVLKFNTLQQAEASFGDFNWEDGDLQAPAQLSVGRDDRIYVADRGAGCVVVYDYFGNYLQSIGKNFLQEPSGIGLHPAAGLLAVTDMRRDQVVIFDQSGRIKGTVGGAGDKLGGFLQPSDAAWYGDQLFVVEAGHHRVQVFKVRFESQGQ